MKRGGGARKGSAFERSICTQLSEWVTDGKDDAVFWRTSGSGARATVRRRKGKETVNNEGDIRAESPDGAWLTDTFCFELQSVKSLDILGFLYKTSLGRYDFLEHWIKCMRDAEATHKYPFMVTKVNRGKVLVFTSEDAYHLLAGSGLDCDKVINLHQYMNQFYTIKEGARYSEQMIGPQYIYGFLFSDFLELDPETVKSEMEVIKYA